MQQAQAYQGFRTSIGLFGSLSVSSTSDLSAVQHRLDPRIEKLVKMAENASDTALEGILETAEVINTLHPKIEKGGLDAAS